LVSKPASATGCSAKIRTRTTTLCGEPRSKKPASSSAWTGVAKFQGAEPVKWAQTGYERRRDQGWTTILFRRYAETKAGPAFDDYDFHTDEAPSAGTQRYKCYLISSLFGTWRYEYDGLLWWQFTRDGWKNVTGTDYQWEAEILSRQDQMVGTASEKCHFTECAYATIWGAFEDANISTGDLHTDDPNEWGIERTNATGFNVWDKHP
jgi:hypothetical protein